MAGQKIVGMTAVDSRQTRAGMTQGVNVVLVLTINHQPWTMNHEPSTINYQLWTGFSPFTVFLTINHKLSTMNWFFTIHYLVTLAASERNEAQSVSRSESHISEVQRTEICWTNYPASAEDIEDIRGIPGA